LPDVKAESRAVGIKDVASAAGVSVTTVSHVLNDVAAARVSPETRNRVRSAAVQLGYGPNRLAQALRGGRTGMLGLVSEDLATAPHAGRIILGAVDAARAHGYALMVINTSATAGPGSREADANALLERQVDGILYVASYHGSVEAPPGLGKGPAILVGTASGPDATSPGEGFMSVVPDEYDGARTAVETLLAAGHTRIGFLSSTADTPSVRQRLRGLRETLASAGLDGGAAPVQAAAPDAQGGYEAARLILAGANPPSALFCYNDQMAMGAYRAAAELGLSIPADLSVVGFEDQELIAANLHPGLTAVALPHYEMGARAAERLIEMVEGPPAPDVATPEPILLNCPLVPRASVAAPQGQTRR
jgi:LacI family transcriptional regulator